MNFDETDDSPDPESCFSSYLSQYPEDDDFTGIYETYWPNGRLQYRGFFEEFATRHGHHIEFWPNGNVKELSTWNHGWIVGTQVCFHENGHRESEIDFSTSGSRSLTRVEKHFGENGDLHIILAFFNGKKSVVWVHKLLAKYYSSEIAAFKEQLSLVSLGDQLRQLVCWHGQMLEMP